MHKSKAADLQGVPKNRLTFGRSVHTAWAINARCLFSRCPSLVQSMPSACSLSVHLTGKTGYLMVSYRTCSFLYLVDYIVPYSYCKLTIIFSIPNSTCQSSILFLVSIYNGLCDFIPNPACQSFFLFIVCIGILYILEELVLKF